MAASVQSARVRTCALTGWTALQREFTDESSISAAGEPELGLASLEVNSMTSNTSCCGLYAWPNKRVLINFISLSCRVYTLTLMVSLIELMQTGRTCTRLQQLSQDGASPACTCRQACSPNSPIHILVHSLFSSIRSGSPSLCKLPALPRCTRSCACFVSMSQPELAAAPTQRPRGVHAVSHAYVHPV